MTKRIVYLCVAIAIMCSLFFLLVLNKKETPTTVDTINLNNIQYKVLKDNLVSDNVAATIYYESIADGSLKTDTYNWNNKKLSSNDNVFQPTYANVFSTKSIDDLQLRMGLTESPVDLYGQLYFYGRSPNYELFIFDGSRIKKSLWKLIFVSDSTVKEVDIQKDLDEVRLDSYQITRDTIYLYTRSQNENDSDLVIYEISTDNYTVTRRVVSLSLFEVKKVIVQLEKIIVKDDELVLATSNYDNVFSGQGVVLRYNFSTKVAKTTFLNHTIHKLLPYKENYLVISDENSSYKPTIKYYDRDFNLLKSSKIVVKSQYGEIVIGARDYFYNLSDDRLYGFLSVDGIANINYLIVLNVNNGEILYLAELTYKQRNFVLQDARFQQIINNKNTDLNPLY